MASTSRADWDYYTRTMGKYCAEFDYKRVPPDAVRVAKTIVMDTLGAMLLASTDRYEGPKILGEFIQEMGGRPECTLVGRDFKSNIVNAALFNGTLGYAADFEGGLVARGHAAAVLVPTALSMCERQRSDGMTLISALVLGYEVFARVSEANRTEHSYPHSFHPSAVFGHFGAAAIAGHFLGLDEEQFINALGLAGINATGLVNWVDDPTEHSRPFVCGVAASNGVRSAVLAQKGFGAPQASLDPGKFSIYDAFSGVSRPQELTEGLGDAFWILQNGGFKRHPCCRDIHTGIDALQAIMRSQGLSGDDIASIMHRVKKDRAPIIDDNELKSHNAQYIMAVAAVNGEVSPDDILHDRRSDPKVAEMYRHVTLVGDPALDPREAERPAVVEVVVKDGRRFVEAADWPKGSPRNPMSGDELRDKFLRSSATAIPQQSAERLLELLDRLETLSSTDDLFELLRV